MTRDQALAQARKRWSKSAVIRRNDTLSSDEKRAEARATMEQIRAQQEEIRTEITRREIAAGIPELRAQLAALRPAKDIAASEALYHAFQVGKIDPILGAFFILGSGDTWEQAFSDADTKSPHHRSK